MSEFLSKRPLLAGAVMLIITLLTFGYLYYQQERNEIRITNQEEASPCAKKPPNIKECRQQLARVVKVYQQRQAQVIVCKGLKGLDVIDKCKIRKVKSGEPQSGKTDQSNGVSPEIGNSPAAPDTTGPANGSPSLPNGQTQPTPAVPSPSAPSDSSGGGSTGGSGSTNTPSPGNNGGNNGGGNQSPSIGDSVGGAIDNATDIPCNLRPISLCLN